MADNPTLAALEALFHDAAMTSAEHGDSTPELIAWARELNARIDTRLAALQVALGHSRHRSGHLLNCRAVTSDGSRIITYTMKTTIESGGGEKQGAAFVVTGEWLEVFLAQRTAELVESALRYAATQSRKVAAVRTLEPTYIDDLVEDVLGDTLRGKIRWDPKRVSLKKHVLDAIQSRTRHDYVRALRFKPLRLSQKSVRLEAESALEAEHAHAETVSRVCAAALQALRDLAADDREVQLLLDAFSQLATKRHEVLKLTGLKPKQYAAARKRMKRLTDQLPASLRRAARGQE